MSFPVEVMGLVVLGIIAAVIVYSWFSGESTAQAAPPEPPSKECRTSIFCSENRNGPYCMSVQNSDKFCGCLFDDDCTKFGIDSTCENFRCT